MMPLSRLDCPLSLKTPKAHFLSRAFVMISSRTPLVPARRRTSRLLIWHLSGCRQP